MSHNYGNRGNEVASRLTANKLLFIHSRHRNVPVMLKKSNIVFSLLTYHVERPGSPNMRMAKNRKMESQTARPVRSVEKQSLTRGLRRT